jgi:tellurite resistance protein
VATTPSVQGLTASRAVSAAARVPASFFSMVMGLGALGAAWRAASRAYGVSAWMADGLLVVSIALWAGLFAAQVAKALTARARLGAELAHPVQGSLAALGPASLLLLAAGLSVHVPVLARALFWIGAAGELALGVHVVGRWLTVPVDADEVTPAMFLPASVGNLLAAIAAAAVGRADAGWLFFGAGVVSWLVVAAVLLGRHLSAGELPPALRPLLGIELAPPALALVAWQALDGPAPDAVSRALLGYALLVALVLVRLAGRYRDVPFAASWWAFTFPVAALATGALRQSAAAPASIAGALALPLFVVANGVVAVIAFRTLTALSRGALLERE